MDLPSFFFLVHRLLPNSSFSYFVSVVLSPCIAFIVYYHIKSCKRALFLVSDELKSESSVWLELPINTARLRMRKLWTIASSIAPWLNQLLPSHCPYTCCSGPCRNSSDRSLMTVLFPLDRNKTTNLNLK